MAKKKNEKTLEELISRLEEISSMIQSGEIGLEDSIELYEEGRRIAKESNERLAAIQKKLEVINPSQLNDSDDASNDDASNGDAPNDLGRDNPILLA